MNDIKVTGSAILNICVRVQC